MEGVFTKKNLVTYLILAILALAIPLSVRVVQLKQVFTPKAADEEITCPDLQTEGHNCVTKTPDVDLMLDSPYGPPQ